MSPEDCREADSSRMTVEREFVQGWDEPSTWVEEEAERRRARGALAGMATAAAPECWLEADVGQSCADAGRASAAAGCCEVEMAKDEPQPQRKGQGHQIA